MTSGVTESPVSQAKVLLYDPMAFVDDSNDKEFTEAGWETAFVHLKRLSSKNSALQTNNFKKTVQDTVPSTGDKAATATMLIFSVSLGYMLYRSKPKLLKIMKEKDIK